MRLRCFWSVVKPFSSFSSWRIRLYLAATVISGWKKIPHIWTNHLFSQQRSGKKCFHWLHVFASTFFHRKERNDAEKHCKTLRYAPLHVSLAKENDWPHILSRGSCSLNSVQMTWGTRQNQYTHCLSFCIQSRHLRCEAVPSLESARWCLLSKAAASRWETTKHLQVPIEALSITPKFPEVNKQEKQLVTTGILNPWEITKPTFDDPAAAIRIKTQDFGCVEIDAMTSISVHCSTALMDDNPPKWPSQLTHQGYIHEE